MVRFIELVLLRVMLWGGLPLLLAVLLIGPDRCWRGVKRAWNWLWRRRLEPEEILAQVVKQHSAAVEALRKALAQAESAEAAIQGNITKSEENVATLEKEAKDTAARGDELGARGAVYKLNLERAAVDTFKEQLVRQRELIAEARRRLYLLELQLRQYEVGRSILLSQLAEAKTAEQQFAIANQFDPFSAVANWERAEGLVEEHKLSAKAAERVHADLTELANSGGLVSVDPAALEAQLAELKGQLGQQPESKPEEEDGARQRAKQTES